MARNRQHPLNVDDASAIALQGLAFLAGDADRLSRFLALTGIGPDDVRRDAATAYFQAAILEYLLSDESLLLVFASDTGIRPETVQPAHALLSGPG